MIKRRIFYFLILFILISCGRNEYEKKLVGNWYSIDENEKITFSKDSLFIYYLSQKVKWNASKDSIKFKIRQLFNYDSIEKVSLKYEFKKDTLLITPHNSNTINPIKFVTADKFLDVVFSKNNVEIDLPKRQNIETLNTQPRYGIKVFVSIDGDSIVSKTQYSDNLKNLSNDLLKHISICKENIDRFKEKDYYIYKNLSEKELEKLWIKFYVHFSVFADKKVSNKDLEIVYSKLKEIKGVKKIYRVYDINESEYVDFYSLKGVKIN